jgi:ankyrin repeat protein
LWAAQDGHKGVIKLLFAIDKADVSTKDNDGQTPLSWAAENRHKGVVKLLLT